MMIKKLILTLALLVLPFTCFGKDIKDLSELTALRSYNTKVYDNGTNSKRYIIHVGHIHYKDKTTKEFKDMDFSLQSDGNNWVMDKSSYEVVIPEYSDQEFVFTNNYEGVDHTIRAIPQTNHIKGVKRTESVFYKDAFATGIDLEVFTRRSGLLKVIIINSKPIGNDDVHFDFELILPQDIEVKNKADSLWNKQTTLDFKDKTLRLGNDGKYSFFTKASLWDSGSYAVEGDTKPTYPIREAVDITLRYENGKTYLRKTITRDILDKAVYPLYTDHPTNYYSGAGDGKIMTSRQYFWQAHDAAVGSNADYTSSYHEYSCGAWGTNGVGGATYRAFYPVNTSGIDDGYTVTAAILYVYVADKRNQDNDGDDWVNVVKTFQASTSQLVTADNEDCGYDTGNEIGGRAMYTPIVVGATAIDVGDITTSAHNAWTLNATGRGWIDVEGWAMLGLREGHDCLDSAPADNTRNLLGLDYSEGSNDAYLDITAEAGGGAARRIILTQ